MAAICGALYYLPIYFQAIKDTPAILSGVYIMPTFLSQLLMAGLSWGILQKMGYVIPLDIFATILLSTGSGLLSTLQPDSSVGKWVGYKIMTDIGSGAGLQLAILAIQGVTTGEELSSGMAFMVFTQSLAPAVILTLCNVILVESLKIQIPEQAPGVDPDAILRAGATGFRSIAASEDLPGVLVAYANSLNRVFYLVAGCAAVSFIFLWGMGWQDLRKKNDGTAPAEESSKESSDEKVMV